MKQSDKLNHILITSFNLWKNPKESFHVAVNDLIAYINKDKIRMLKRICRNKTETCEIFSDCSDCQIHRELNKLRGNK